MNTQYIELIKSLKGPTLARIITRTEVKMNKKDVETKSIPNPYVGAVKVTTMIVELAPQYEATVNEQRVEEGKVADFEASSRKWGQNLGNGLVEHNGKMYVSFIPKEHILNSYLVGDQIVDKSVLEPFIPKKKDNNQGVDKEVAFRTVSLENLYKVEVL